MSLSVPMGSAQETILSLMAVFCLFFVSTVKSQSCFKLSSVSQLPYVMNELTLTELDMGFSIPKILHASKPSVDHQGRKRSYTRYVVFFTQCSGWSATREFYYFPAIIQSSSPSPAVLHYITGYLSVLPCAFLTE